MSSAETGWAQDWQVSLRVGVERAGQAVLSEGRLDLLAWIDRCHSISAAARQMGVSYRHAWVTVQAVNQAAGMPLVEAATGGRRGGGAHLTPQGHLAVALFRRLRDQLQHTAATLLPRLLPGPAPGGLRVAAAISLEEALDQLAVAYTLRHPAMPVRVLLGASDALAEQVLAGAAVDVFLSANGAQLERLAAAGALATEPATPLATNVLAVVAPAGSTLTARRPGDLLRPAVRRIALAAPSCPLGAYTRAYLERLGLYAQFAARAVLVDHSRAVAATVAARQADAGLVYGSATAAAAGCRVLFRIGSAGGSIQFAGVVTRGTAQPQAARDFLAFLASKEAVRRFRRCGFLPARGKE